MPAAIRLVIAAQLCLACSAVRIEVQPAPTGSVTSTIGEPAPHEVRPAHIYEIDGRPVLYQRRSFLLEPGEHLVRVWPEGPAQRVVPDLAAIEEDEVAAPTSGRSRSAPRAARGPAAGRGAAAA